MDEPLRVLRRTDSETRPLDNICIKRQERLKDRQGNSSTTPVNLIPVIFTKNTCIYGNTPTVNTVGGENQWRLAAIDFFSGHTDETRPISLSFTQWSEPQSNYSSGTVITQSLSMHLITGVLTKNNRFWTPVTQNEIWRGDSEMITACKSSHKIGSHYVSHSNGLFNKTLIVRIMSRSSLQ